MINLSIHINKGVRVTGPHVVDDDFVSVAVVDRHQERLPIIISKGGVQVARDLRDALSAAIEKLERHDPSVECDTEHHVNGDAFTCVKCGDSGCSECEPDMEPCGLCEQPVCGDCIEDHRIWCVKDRADDNRIENEIDRQIETGERRA